MPWAFWGSGLSLSLGLLIRVVGGRHEVLDLVRMTFRVVRELSRMRCNSV